MVKPPTGGVQTLPTAFRTAFGAILSDVSEIMNTSYASDLAKDFLLKMIRVQIQLEDFPESQKLWIGFARGDMTIGNISAALSTVLANPEDLQLWDSWSTSMMGIYWESMRMIGGNDTTNSSYAGPGWDETISIGGGKGIPLEAGIGIQLFIFNATSGSLANAGSTLVGLYQLVGVWLSQK